MRRPGLFAGALAWALVLATACDGPDGEAQDTDRWADTMVPPIGPATGGGGDEDEGDGEGGDEEEDEDELGFWAGYGAVTPGVDFVGEGELSLGAEDEEECILLFDIVDSVPLSDCPGCDFAFELTYGRVEAEVDEGCAALGIPPERVEGRTQTIGYVGGEALLVRVSGTWIVGGEALDAPGGFEFELPFVPEEAP